MLATSFFDGLSPEELQRLLDRCTPRTIPAGSVLLAEGDGPSLMYVILDGAADIMIRDRDGKLQRINGVTNGDTIGEMSLLTGDAVSATVRTTTDTVVVTLSESELQRSMEQFPILYRNLGAILSERLAQSNRRTLRERVGEVTLLVRRGGPHLVGYALSCSMAWHTQQPTLHLRVASDPASDSLASIGHVAEPTDAFTLPASWTASGQRARARLLLVTPQGIFAPDRLGSTVERLREVFDHVVVEWIGDDPPVRVADRTIRLFDPESPAGDPEGGARFRAIQPLNGSRSAAADRGGGVLRIPDLSIDDEKELVDGVLPSSSPAGTAIGWGARDLTRLKVGLALGAGSVKGYAHIGVLSVLERLGVPIDCLSGTSIGAAVSATYALGHDLDGVAKVLDDVGGAAFRLTIPMSSVLSMSGIRDGVQRVGGAMRFEDLSRPLGVVATDIASGNEIVFKRGLLWPAVLASMAIPGIYPPQRIGHRVLVDGGVLNPVPSSVAADLGADIVIAVKLASRASSVPVEAEGKETGGKTTSIVQSISRSIELMQGKIGTDTANAATIQIEPTLGNVGGWGLRTFKQGRRYIESGQAAAEESLPRLQATLPWLRTPNGRV